MSSNETTSERGKEHNAVTPHYKPTLLEKLGWYLYPHKQPATPELKDAKDVYVIMAAARLGFADRFRVLVSGKIELETRTVCQYTMGKAVHSITMNVRPPDCLVPKGENQ
jgi:hypothetical protein